MIRLHPLVLQKSRIHACVFPFDPNASLWRLCFDNIVTIATRAVLVALFIDGHVLAEGLFSLLTYERHVRRPRERMGLCLGVAF